MKKAKIKVDKSSIIDRRTVTDSIKRRTEVPKYVFTIGDLQNRIGNLDATHEGPHVAAARYALDLIEGYDIPAGSPHQYQENIKRLADILEAYALALQVAGVEVNPSDPCDGKFD